MKVAVDGLNIRKGGGETVLLRVCAAFIRSGHTVELFTGTESVADKARMLDPGLTATMVPAAGRAVGGHMTRIVAFDRMAKERGCDLAFGLNYWFPTSLPLVIYHINVIPFLSLRERISAVGLLRALMQGAFGRRALTHADCNLFESEHLQNLAVGVSRKPVRQPKVRYIGVELPTARPGEKETKRKVIAVTSPALHKRNEHLFALHNRLNRERKGDPIGLQIVGVSSDDLIGNPAVAAQIEKSVAPQAIEFLGYVGRSELFDQLSSAIALVSFSELESFFMVALESMAAGCPAVVADASSIDESVGDAGMLMPPGDVEAAAVLVEQLLDPAIRAERSAKGLAWVQQFEAKHCADLIVQDCERSVRRSA